MEMDIYLAVINLDEIEHLNFAFSTIAIVAFVF